MRSSVGPVLVALVALGGAAPSQVPADLTVRIRALEARIDGLERRRGIEAAVETLASDLGVEPIDTSWRERVRWSTDSGLQLELGGRIHCDAALALDDDAAGTATALEDPLAIRRARIELAGRYRDTVDFRLGIELSGGRVRLLPAWMGLRNVPWLGKVRVGHLRQPQGLERHTTTNDLVFLERATTDALLPGRDAGLLITNVTAARRVTWAAGIFFPADALGATSSGSAGVYHVAGRFVLRPRHEIAEDALVHLAVSLGFREGDDDGLRLRARPDIGLARRRLDTGPLPFRGATTLAAELAWREGPWLLAAEAAWLRVDVDGGPAATTWGGHVMLAWTLTGEARPYHEGRGAFERLVPASPWPGGPGAWQVAVRAAHLNLSDGAADGGRATTVTAALNWFANERLHVAVNLVWSDLEDGVAGDLLALAFRVQLTF